MAEAIAAGIRDTDPSITVKLMNSAKEDKNDIVSEVFRSKAILVGSSTINNGYLFSIGGMLEMIKGLKFKNKRAAAFGSYGWSGEAVKQMTEAGKGRLSNREQRAPGPVGSRRRRAGKLPGIRQAVCRRPLKRNTGFHRPQSADKGGIL